MDKNILGDISDQSFTNIMAIKWQVLHDNDSMKGKGRKFVLLY